MADIETFYDASYHAALKVAREIATTNGRQGPVRRKDLLEGVMRVAPHAFSHLLGQKVILLGIPDLLPMPSALPAEKLTPAAERLIDLEHGWLGAVFADLKGPVRHVEALHLAAALLFEGNQAVLKMLLYRVVNGVFFGRKKSVRWLKSLVFAVSVEGILLYPLVLLQSYFDLSVQKAVIYVFFVIALVKMLLLYKSFVMFFKQKPFCLQIILYFCALEIMPLLSLWGVLVKVVDYLKINI